MLTTREFKIAKLNRARAVRMYRIRNRAENEAAASFVDQFMVNPKYMGHRAVLRTKIFMAMVWEHIWGIVAILLGLTVIGLFLVFAVSAFAGLFALIF